MSSILTELSPEQLSSTPLELPPQGIQSNFGDAKNNNEPVIVLCSLFLAIMVCFYVNRVYTKTCIVRKYSWDDVTISFALLGSIVMFVACIWGEKRGRFGNHAWDISVAQISGKDLPMTLWIMSCFPPIVYLFLKNTFFIMYLYIFGPLRWMRICAYTGATITTVVYICMAVAFFVLVTPRQGETWSEHLFSQENPRSGDLLLPISGFGLVIDLVILVLPITAVMQLQLPIRRRIGVISVFMTGSLACVFSMLVICFRKKYDRSKDAFWDSTAVNVLMLLEVFVGIICACAPAAARSYSHHLKNFSSLKTFLTSQLSRIGLGTKQSPASLPSRKGNHQAGRYSNINVYQGPGYTGKAQNKGIQTFIDKGKQHDVENDGIYLTFEMHNQFSEAGHPVHDTATSLERLDTNYDPAVSEMTTHDQSEQV